MERLGTVLRAKRLDERISTAPGRGLLQAATVAPGPLFREHDTLSSEIRQRPALKRTASLLILSSGFLLMPAWLLIIAWCLYRVAAYALE